MKLTIFFVGEWAASTEIRHFLSRTTENEKESVEFLQRALEIFRSKQVNSWQAGVARSILGNIRYREEDQSHGQTMIREGVDLVTENQSKMETHRLRITVGVIDRAIEMARDLKEPDSVRSWLIQKEEFQKKFRQKNKSMGILENLP